MLRPPIIAMSPHAVRGDGERLLDSGFAGYASKARHERNPFDAAWRFLGAQPARPGERAGPAQILAGSFPCDDPRGRPAGNGPSRFAFPPVAASRHRGEHRSNGRRLAAVGRFS